MRKHRITFKYALIFAVGLLSLFSAERLAAQKMSADPRPLRGLKPDSIRTYSSIGEFLGRSRGSGLTLHATPSSTAVRRMVQARVASPTRRKEEQSNIAPSRNPIEISRATNGTINWMTGSLGRADAFVNPLELKGGSRELQAATVAVGVAEAYQDVLGLNNPSAELRTVSAAIDDLGSAHVRMAQTYRGIPVWGRDLYIHSNAAGEVYAINGTYEPTPAGVATAPDFSGTVAITKAIDDLKSRNAWAPIASNVARSLGISEPQAMLVLYPHADRTIYLAYEVTLHASLLQSFTYLIDAHSGAVLGRFARHCSFLGHEHDHAGAAEVVGFGDVHHGDHPLSANSPATFGDATSMDLNGVTRTVRTYQHTDGLHYAIWDLPNFNAGASTPPSTLAGGALTLTANQNEIGSGVLLSHVTSADNQWSDASAVSAHSNMKITYDYFRETFARKAIDDNDKTLVSVIHVSAGGQPMDNAFWNGEMMAYGDGNVLCKPMAGALDVAGHEMTHGVIQHTANLLYQGQSGALNESIADLFGIMIDRDDFYLGEDILLPGHGPATRDFSNPNNPQVLLKQPVHMSQYQNLPVDVDNGGVHTNSGIPNRAAYLMINAMGRLKVEQIYYRALTTYLTRNSQFIDCRRAVLQATKDLYGEGEELDAAEFAFDIVGITDDQPGKDPNDVPPLEGTSLVTFLTEDGRIGILDAGAGGMGMFEPENGATARITETLEGTDATLLSAPRNGRNIYFINDDGRLAFVDIITGLVSVFNDLHIQADGDLWNASVSPDENYVALTSAYVDDAAIYITDGQQIGRIELTPESTQDSIRDETVKYADVLSWSPNMAIPRLAFDAYREMRLGDNTTMNFWSMYELDLESSRIYNLIPGQSADVNIGNITYSKTDPDVVAMNVISHDGIHDVMVMDYETGMMEMLDIPEYSIGDKPITDAQRPTFSPDDSEMMLSSPENNALLLFDSELGLVATIQLAMPGPMYNPHWFTYTGTSSVENSGSANATAVTGVTPNPFRGSTSITFRLAAPGDVKLEVLNTLGQKVATLVNGRLGAGEHTAALNAESLPAGMYLIRLHTAGATVTERAVLVR